MTFGVCLGNGHQVIIGADMDLEYLNDLPKLTDVPFIYFLFAFLSYDLLTYLDDKQIEFMQHTIVYVHLVQIYILTEIFNS